jgi:hypothetical protein
MNNIVNLSPWAARATEVTADPALARFLAPVERRNYLTPLATKRLMLACMMTRSASASFRRHITFCKTQPRMML